MKQVFRKEDLRLELLNNFKPDLIFFPHWSWIVDRKIFLNFTCIVFHAAPLPYGRGGSPIQNLIIRGYKKTSVCAIKMKDGIDSGPIYIKKNISLNGSLSDILIRLNTAINYLMIRLIKKLPNPKNQKGKIFKFKRLSLKNNKINLNSDFNHIYNKIRMLDYPSYPSAYISLKKIKIEFSKITKVGENLFCKVRISKKI